MNVLFKTIAYLFLLLMICQRSPAQNSILDGYIQEGLRSNLVLQQKNISAENALNVLEQMKRLYRPSLDFQTLYTTAKGGRDIDIPVGDMLNPVYSTLNQLTGQSNFPSVKNEKINFLPQNFYDARIRISVPIINTDIRNNTHILQNQLAIRSEEVRIYERELIKEIKTTYYNYLSAIETTEIYQNAINMAEEGKRTNEKLIAAGKGLYAYMMRSETEIAEANTKKTSAELQAKTIQRYFNALLNRDAGTEIETEISKPRMPLIPSNEISPNNREELDVSDRNVLIKEDILNLNRQVFVPKLSGFADAGSQAEQMRLNNQSVYFMLGLQLNIPIFSNGRNKLKIQEAKNEVKIAGLRQQYAVQQLEVAVTKAYNEVLTEKSNYETSLKQLEMAETYFRLISKGYVSGVNTYIETLDSRTQLTTAQIAVSINYYRCLAALATLERETASYPLPDQK